MSDGFFWVRRHDGDWQPAQRTVDDEGTVYWVVLGIEEGFGDEEFAEIGERLTPPA